MRYLPKSDDERREMLDVLGLRNLDDLFAHIPAEIRLNRPLALPAGWSEYEILRYFR